MIGVVGTLARNQQAENRKLLSECEARINWCEQQATKFAGHWDGSGQCFICITGLQEVEYPTTD